MRLQTIFFQPFKRGKAHGRPFLKMAETMFDTILLKFTRLMTQLSLKISEVRSNPIAYGFYAIVWIVSTIGVLPFDVAMYGWGYMRLTPVYGFRRWCCVVLCVDVFIYICFMLSNFWNKDLHFIKDGMVTIDVLLLAAAAGLMVTALLCAKLLLYSQDGLVTIRDQLNVLFNSFSEKYLQGQQLYQLYSKEFSLLVMVGFFPLATLMTPCLLAVLVFVIRGSPGTFTYYTVRDSWWMYLGCVHDWLVSTFAVVYLAGTAACMFEGALSVSFFIRAIRKPNLQNLTWKQKLSIHASLELAVDETNRTVGLLEPVFVADAFLCSCVLLSVVFHVLGNIWSGDIPSHTPEILLGSSIALGGTLVCSFFALRNMEILNLESKALLKELQSEGCALEKRRRGMRGFMQQLVLPRDFRRRPLAAKLSIFMPVEWGLGISFLEAVADYSLQLMLMVDGSQPILLLRPRVVL